MRPRNELISVTSSPRKTTKHLHLGSIPSMRRISVSGVVGTDLQRAWPTQKLSAIKQVIIWIRRDWWTYSTLLLIKLLTPSLTAFPFGNWENTDLTGKMNYLMEWKLAGPPGTNSSDYWLDFGWQPEAIRGTQRSILCPICIQHLHQTLGWWHGVYPQANL